MSTIVLGTTSKMFHSASVFDVHRSFYVWCFGVWVVVLRRWMVLRGKWWHFTASLHYFCLQWVSSEMLWLVISDHESDKAFVGRALCDRRFLRCRKNLQINLQQPSVSLTDLCNMPSCHEADWRCDASQVFPKTTFTAFYIHCVVRFYGLSMFIGSCFTLLGDCSSNISICIWHICSTLMFKADVVCARATSVYVLIAVVA